MLPLTPLQQGLLFHAGIAQGSDDDAYAVQLDFTITGPLDPHRLREAVDTVVTGIRIWWPASPTSSASRCRSSPTDPVCRGAMSSWAPRTWMSRSRFNGCAPLNVPRSASWPSRRLFGLR